MSNGTDQPVTPPSHIWENISCLIVAWFPFFVVLVLIPFAVFVPNQEDFGDNLFFPLLSALAAFFCLLPLTPLLLLRVPLRTRIAAILFFLGVYMALADILAPIDVGDLSAGPTQVRPVEPPFLTLVEVVLLIASLWAAIRLPAKWVVKIGAPFVVVLVMTQGFYFSANIPGNMVIRWGNRILYETKPSADAPASLANSGNIYQICIDSYSSLLFLDALKEIGNTSAFDGFTFYENNRSNYVFTRGSFPSYMTATFFKGGSTEKWRKARFHGGMIKTLHNHGFRISIYAPFAGYYHETASHTRQLLDVIKNSEEPESMFGLMDFVDLCLLRIVPNSLQQELYTGGVGLMRRRFVSTTSVGNDSAKEEDSNCQSDIAHCLPLMRALISEEEERPDHGQYVYVHLWITHNPIGTRNADCSRNSAGNSTYLDHVVCATRVVERFLSELKKLGRYKSSTIIVQSDHGHADIGPKSTQHDPMSEQVAKRLQRISQIDPQVIANKTYALLLIKPPGESGTPLRLSKSPTALVDLPATVFSLLGLNEKTEQGRPTFSLEESDQREIHMFAGFVRGGGKEKPAWFRTPLKKGTLCHFAYINDRGWKLYPDIPFTRN
jgi:hypothetical protein